MTTYRRFCCNDLLRLGSLRTNSGTPTQPMAFYIYLLGTSPGNCHVADAPGGRIAGCILGHVIRDGAEDIGHVSMLRILHKDLTISLTGKFLKLMEDCCGKIYAMRIFLVPMTLVPNINFKSWGMKYTKRMEKRIEMRKRLSRPISRSPSEDELDRIPIESSRLTGTTGILRPTSESSSEVVQDEPERIERIERGRLTSFSGRLNSRSSSEDDLITLLFLALNALD